jgi:hypothetical protein
MTNNVTPNSNSSLEGQRENSTTPADWNNFTFDHFSKITETTGKIREELDKLSQCNNGKPSEKAKIIAPITNWFIELESKMNDLSKFVFGLSNNQKTLIERIEKLEATVAINVASGDLVSDIERSAGYKDLCNETMLASLSSKVPNLDLGAHIDRDSDISLIETVKTKLSSTLTPKVLSDVVITPLAKETFEKNDKFIVPVLLKSKTKQGKVALDKALKTKGLDVNFHWPKQLFPIIKSLREKYQNVKSEDIDLTSKQILIRPSATGKSIMVSYRTRLGTNWTFLESFKTPAPQAMLENTKFLQPFSSKYIQM